MKILNFVQLKHCLFVTLVVCFSSLVFIHAIDNRNTDINNLGVTLSTAQNDDKEPLLRAHNYEALSTVIVLLIIEKVVKLAQTDDGLKLLKLSLKGREAEELISSQKDHVGFLQWACQLCKKGAAGFGSFVFDGVGAVATDSCRTLVRYITLFYLFVFLSKTGFLDASFILGSLGWFLRAASKLTLVV